MKRIRSNVVLALAIGTLCGCSTAPYIEPTEGPLATLSVHVKADGGWRRWTHVQTFDDPENCGGMKRILKDESYRRIRIKAEAPTTLRFVYVTQSGFPIIEMTNCNLIVTFDPKRDREYRAEAAAGQQRCAISIIDTQTGEPQLLRARQFVDVISGGGNVCK